MPSPDAVLRRLNLRFAPELYPAEISAIAEMCLTPTAPPDAERRFTEALDTARHGALHPPLPPRMVPTPQRPAGNSNPNNSFSFITTAPVERVVEITPFLLEPVDHPETAFTLAVLILSRARELSHFQSLIASLLSPCCSDAIPHELRVIALSALLAAIPPNHPLVREITNNITRSLIGANKQTLHTAAATNFPSATPLPTIPDDGVALLSLLRNDAEHRAADATAPTTLANTSSNLSNPALASLTMSGAAPGSQTGRPTSSSSCPCSTARPTWSQAAVQPPPHSPSSTTAHWSTQHGSGRRLSSSSSTRSPAAQRPCVFRPKAPATFPNSPRNSPPDCEQRHAVFKFLRCV